MQGLDDYQDNPILNETLQEPSNEVLQTSGEVIKSSIGELSEKIIETKAKAVELALPPKIMLDQGTITLANPVTDAQIQTSLEFKQVVVSERGAKTQREVVVSSLKESSDEMSKNEISP